MGFGCVIRDHSTKVLRVICGPLGICDSIKAKAMDLLLGLRELKKIGVIDCMVEDDSATIISWGLGKGDGSWCLASIIYEIRELISLLNCSITHVDRSQNELADKLAN